MKLMGFDTRGILCGREGHMVISKSGTVGFLQQIARQNHVVHTSKLKVGSLICVASLNARMKLTGFDRSGILYARRAQMVPSKSGEVEFLRLIERGNPVNPVLSSDPLRFGSLICATALNPRSSTEQKQVITDEEKSVELDEGGSGFPPDDSDGGGGGGNWFGGFFFFGLLAFLRFLKDNESECFYCDDRRRGGLNTSHNLSILTDYLHKILHFLMNVCPELLKLIFAILLVIFNCPGVFYIFAFVDWETLCFWFSVLAFLVLVSFIVCILSCCNLITGLTGRGGSDDLLSRLLNWRYRSADSSSEITSPANELFNPECCICLAEYEDNEEIRTLPCSHVFHLECVNQWLRIQSFCPLCKRNVQR